MSMKFVIYEINILFLSGEGPAKPVYKEVLLNASEPLANRGKTFKSLIPEELVLISEEAGRHLNSSNFI